MTFKGSFLHLLCWILHVLHPRDHFKYDAVELFHINIHIMSINFTGKQTLKSAMHYQLPQNLEQILADLQSLMVSV